MSSAILRRSRVLISSLPPKCLRAPVSRKSIIQRLPTASSPYSTTSRCLAAQPTGIDQKARNFEQAAQEVGRKMQAEPGSVTSEDAAYLKSREARVIGQGQPPADSISAEAQRLASANEEDTKTSSRGQSQDQMDPATQSTIDRTENFQDAAEQVGSKMANAPEQVTKEEADLLHSREQRAAGATSKGGIASQAQSLAAENEKKGTI